jgi:hypothetical protein
VNARRCYRDALALAEEIGNETEKLKIREKLEKAES